jgi:hypothetical protein
MNVGLLGAAFATAHVVGTSRSASPDSNGAERRKDATRPIKGVSAKRQVLGQKVYNSQGEIVGKIEDLILTKRAISYAIMSAGGFLGLARQDVAIAVDEFVRDGDRILLPDGNREAMLARPRFEYAQVED